MKAEPAPTKPITEQNETPSRAKQGFAIAGGALLALAVAYGVGRYQGGQAVSAADDRASAAAEEQKKSEAALAGEKGVVLQLEARRRLHLAALALDERNFGIAEQHVADASKLIQKSAPAADSGIAKLGAELSSERLVATEDIGAQRAKLLGWVKRFDELLPPAKP